MSTNGETVGVLGLGLAGSAAAHRILDAGRSVVGFDVDNSKQQAFAQAGGRTVDACEDLFRETTQVLICLPTSRDVLTVLQTSSFVLRSDHLLLDMTTGDPEEVLEIVRSIGESGASYVEAKIAGSSEQLRRGEAVLLLAGDAGKIAEVHPLIGAITDRHFELGETPTASRFKLVHNLVLGLHRAVLAEALRFAEANGLSVDKTLEILAETPARSAVMDSKGSKMVSGDFAPQATVSQHLKDVRLILAEARRVGAYVPLSSIHACLLERLEKYGFGGADNSAIIKAFDRK